MARARTILIVEDDQDLRRMIRQSLQFLGYAVQEAGDGLAALRILDNAAPDAVILDLGLPVISGYGVRAEIAAQAHTKHIPVLVITGTAGDHSSLDAACVLQKPFDMDDLLRAVHKCIASVGT